MNMSRKPTILISDENNSRLLHHQQLFKTYFVVDAYSDHGDVLYYLKNKEYDFVFLDKNLGEYFILLCKRLYEENKYIIAGESWGDEELEKYKHIADAMYQYPLNEKEIMELRDIALSRATALNNNFAEQELTHDTVQAEQVVEEPESINQESVQAEEITFNLTETSEEKVGDTTESEFLPETPEIPETKEEIVQNHQEIVPEFDLNSHIQQAQEKIQEEVFEIPITPNHQQDQETVLNQSHVQEPSNQFSFHNGLQSGQQSNGGTATPEQKPKFNSTELTVDEIYKSRIRRENMQEIKGVYSFYSPKGGTGKTTIVTNLGVMMARHLPNTSVVLIDFDIFFGNVASLLNLEPKFTILDWINLPDKVEKNIMPDLLLRHESGLWVLPAPTKTIDESEVTEELADKVIENLREIFDVVLIDLGPIYRDSSIKAFDHSDQIFLISDLDRNTLADCYDMKGDFPLLGVSLDKVTMILNNVTGKEGITIKQAKELMPFPVQMVLPHEVKMKMAVNNGRIFVDAMPKASFTKNMLKFVSRLFDTSINVTKPNFFKRLFRRGEMTT